jgi:copper chaperone
MNVVLIIILIAVVVLAAVSGAKHFKGQGGCCGGGGELRPERKKLDGPVTEKKIISIDGMSCENCRNRVERAINKIDGASARVNLRKKEAVVSLDREIDDETLKNAVESAGYKAVSVKTREVKK